jgi:chaperone modulatory protein CbpM
MSYALVRANEVDLGAFAAAAGLHPELVRRLVVLGILDASCDASGDLWFTPGELAVVARMQRLRGGLGLNYASVGLVLDLLDRITALEAALRRAGRPGG